MADFFTGHAYHKDDCRFDKFNETWPPLLNIVTPK